MYVAAHIHLLDKPSKKVDVDQLFFTSLVDDEFLEALMLIH
jgi:hypothetical protein